MKKVKYTVKKERADELEFIHNLSEKKKNKKTTKWVSEGWHCTITLES